MPEGRRHEFRSFIRVSLEEGKTLDVGESQCHGEDEEDRREDPLADRVTNFASIEYHHQKTFHNFQKVFGGS